MDKTFTVTSHEYTNTGGHWMVSVFTVYDSSAKSIRYVVCNDERLNFMTFDTIHNDPPAEFDHDEFILESYTYDLLTTESCCDNVAAIIDEDKFLLFKHCQFEHYKKDCEFFGHRIHLSVDELPRELYNELSPHAIDWHKKHGDLVTTDGYQVWPSEGYEPPPANGVTCLTKYASEIADFKRWFDDLVADAMLDGTLEEYYSKSITIVFNGRALELAFAADEFDVISTALLEILDRIN